MGAASAGQTYRKDYIVEAPTVQRYRIILVGCFLDQHSLSLSLCLSLGSVWLQCSRQGLIPVKSQL